MKRMDLTGKRFTLLTVTHQDENLRTHWHCKCDCGNLKRVQGASLRSGNTKSCGCLSRSNPGRPRNIKFVPMQDFINQCGMHITPMREFLKSKDVIVALDGTYTAKGKRYGPYPSPVHALAMAMFNTVETST